MSKLTKRLQSIADFVQKKDELVDVGCDHGLLSIYLAENKLCKRVIASDINLNALQSAINNISKSKAKIETVLSDGLQNIDMNNINTLVISGMGTGTILHILEDKDKLVNVEKLIIQSNNDHEELRRELNKKGYSLTKEEVLKERNKWYITMLFKRNSTPNSEEVIKYGLLTNKEYNESLLKEMNRINDLIPFYSIKDKLNQNKKIKEYKEILEKHHN